MPRPFGVLFLVCSVGFAAVGSAAAAAAALEQPATTDLERRRPWFCGCAAEGRQLLSQQHARPAATAADAHCAAATCPRASPPLSPKYLARSGRECPPFRTLHQEDGIEERQYRQKCELDWGTRLRLCLMLPAGQSPLCLLHMMVSYASCCCNCTAHPPCPIPLAALWVVTNETGVT